MGGDELVASVNVGRGDDRVDLVQGHLEGTEAPDDLGGGDLLGGVTAVAGGRVYISGLQEADPVVVTERLDTQVRGTGEIADGQGGVHASSMRPPLRGDATFKEALDPPVRAAGNLEVAAEWPSETEGTESMTTDLTGVVADHIAAVNAFDTDAIVATFAEDAYVNDNRREISGIHAIRRFMEKEFVGDHVTMEVLEVVDHYGDTIVRARYDGTYDKTNLPEVLIMSSYFSVRDDKIVSLAVIFNQPSQY